MDKCNICGINSDNIIRTGIITGNLCKQCFDKNYLTENGKRTYLRRDYTKLLKFINSESSRVDGVDKNFLGCVLNVLREKHSMIFVGYKINDPIIRLVYEDKNRDDTELKRINIKYLFKNNKIEVRIQHINKETFKIKQEDIRIYEKYGRKIKVSRKV